MLQQRQDISQEEANNIVSQIESTRDHILNRAREVQQQAKVKADELRQRVEDYLRNTNKDELNPEGIKREFKVLLDDPQAGISLLRSHLSQFDRSTIIVALLSQRQDISEEEANQIVDQIELIRTLIVEQFQQIQQKVQSVLDAPFAKVRNYLNSLDRSELNYEGIKQDFAKVFDDPQAGFEALRDRLSKFDRDTLLAVISSHEDISQTDANRIIDQIEAARDGVLQRAERIQKETQKRLKAIQKQAEESKKTVASAAWWIFRTAITSLCASAIGSAIAVTGITLPG